MTAHECEEYIEEPPQRKRYALRKPERQRDFLRLKLTLPSERRTDKPPPDPLLVLCRLQIRRGSRCSTVTKIPDTTGLNLKLIPRTRPFLSGPRTLEIASSFKGTIASFASEVSPFSSSTVKSCSIFSYKMNSV